MDAPILKGQQRIAGKVEQDGVGSKVEAFRNAMLNYSESDGNNNVQHF